MGKYDSIFKDAQEVDSLAAVPKYLADDSGKLRISTSSRQSGDDVTLPGVNTPSNISSDNTLRTAIKGDTDAGEGGGGTFMDYEDAQLAQQSYDPAESYIPEKDDFSKNMRHTSIWYNFVMTPEEQLREVKDLSIETGFPEKALIDSESNREIARKVYKERRSVMEMAKQDPSLWLDDTGNSVSMTKVYDRFPVLKSLEDNPDLSDVDIALVMNNIKDVKETKGIVDAALTGKRKADVSKEISDLGLPYLYGKDMDPDIKKKRKALYDKIENDHVYPDFFDKPIENVVGNTAEQLPRLVRGFVKGQGYGAALGATGAMLAGGATMVAAGGDPLAAPAAIAAAKSGALWGYRIGSKFGMAADMFLELSGERVFAFYDLKDKESNRLLNDNEVCGLAMISGCIYSAIEF